MRHILTVGNTDIPYEVRFSSRAARKRIVVTPAGVLVVAPAGTRWGQGAKTRPSAASNNTTSQKRPDDMRTKRTSGSGISLLRLLHRIGFGFLLMRSRTLLSGPH